MSRNASDSLQLEVGNPQLVQPPPGANEPAHSRPGNKVYKSGPLFLASRGIGWTSWKKRWFILTRTSLVFFRSDPNSVPPKGEVNLTLGGIDLNSSGSVVVKEDKKLITVLFPDGKDGRAFTLKSETLEDLHEWKNALEEALANAPSAALGMGQNGILKNDQTNATDLSLDQSKDRQPVKSLVIGRPILLALEDIDGTPSFLEKALRFVEEYGVKVEGILRQAAYVDDVERRIREYEQGKTEFVPEEDAHVIADCVKYILRELPSSPVPASCCNALLEACRTDRSMRVSAMRNAICETFPEPNRRLLQRILMMMQSVAANKAQNRMSISAVAACMAPLLLRPLLQGDCELQQNFDVVDDGSVQLLQAAAAANHAQAICITLLEEYDKLFGEGTGTPELYSETEESGSESEELSEDYESSEGDGDGDLTEGSGSDVDDNFERASSGTGSDTEDKYKVSVVSGSSHSGSRSEQADDIPQSGLKWKSKSVQTSFYQHDSEEANELNKFPSPKPLKFRANDNGQLVVADPAETSHSVGRPTNMGRTLASASVVVKCGKKNLSSEDVPSDEEAEIQRLEATKAELQNRIAEEAKGNQQLQESLERRKNALHERRLDLEKDVERLQEQLQKEKELRAVLEAGLKVPVSSSIDAKMKGQLEDIAQAESDISNLKQKADDLGAQLTQQREQNSWFQHDPNNYPLPPTPNQPGKLKDKQNDVDSTFSSSMTEKSTRSKHDTHLDLPRSDKHKKKELLTSLRINSPQILPSEPLSNPGSAEILATSSSAEAGIGKPASSNSRKSDARGEGSNSTPSPLAKLTNRLNFLKERRTQIANELQNMDKGRDTHQPIPQPFQSNERSKAPESRRSTPTVDRIQGSFEGQSSERSRVDNYQSFPSPETGRRPEGLPNLERGKSESFPAGDKNNQPNIPSRTFSR